MSPAQPRLQGLRVLLVEDAVDAAEALRMLLGMEGAQVEVAFDGRQGLRALERDTPDIVISDIGMPNMDGHDFARALRADPRWAALPLIALSGFGRGQDGAATRKAGFDLHVDKPIDIDTLVARIGQLVTR